MSNNEDDTQPSIYHNPQNFDEAGGILGGLIKTPNAIEAAVICIALYYTEFIFLFFWPMARLVVGLVTIIPIGFIALAGIRGQRLSMFLLSVYNFYKRKRQVVFKLPNTDDITLTQKQKESAVKKVTAKLFVSKAKKERRGS